MPKILFCDLQILFQLTSILFLLYARICRSNNIVFYFQCWHFTQFISRLLLDQHKIKKNVFILADIADLIETELTSSYL